jgi:filamentous hemagglutinin family protein
MIKYLYPFLTTTVCLLPTIAHAQIYQPSNRTPVADTTLGTQVSGNGNNFNITGGLNKGQTLFHSFTDFSVPTNGQANFSNPVGNRDIITRVTGNVFSDINGLVNTNGANFFLINPNGIVFGTNARLNVGKAFVGSTANSIDLVDGSGRAITFGTNPNGDALLTVAPNVLFDVSRLNMGGGTGAISNFGTLQTNNPSQYIGLIGGNVSMNGGEINAPGGRVELGGLSSVGTVALGVDVNNLQVQFPTNVERGDVSLINGSRVNVAGSGGGDITISARNLQILGGSSVRGGIEQDLGTPGAVAGDIKLNTTGQIVVSSNSGIFNDVGPNSIGQGGNVTIDAGSLSLRDNAKFSAATFGGGNAGNVNITAKDAVSLTGEKTTIFNTVEAGGVGKGGNIHIDAGSLSLQDNAQLSTATSGQGDAGNITVTAKNAVSLVNASMLSTVEAGGVGKGGNIEIDARTLSLLDSAQLSTITREASDPQPPGRGNAGNITVKVNGSVDIAGRKGDFGSVISSNVNPGTEGNGGNITIDAGSFSLRDGAFVSAGTFGEGNAGTIKVNATDFVTISGMNGIFRSALFVGSFSETGTAGDIVVTSPKITLDSGIIQSQSLVSNGGNIHIGGKLNAEAAFSLGSKIDLTNLIAADLLLLRRGGNISTNARGTAQQGGDGGNININSNLIVAISKENSDITANAVKGRGGNVNIDSQGLFGIQFRPRQTDNSDITASSDFDRQGNVNIETPGTDPGRDSTELPNTTTDASNQISQVCSANNRQNKLTVTGRGGLPPNANDPLTSDVIWQDARAASSQPAVSSAPTPAKLAPPAVGMVFDGKGKVTLIAAGTQGQPTGTRLVCPNVVGK